MITLTVRCVTVDGEKHELELTSDEAANLAQMLRIGLRMVADAKSAG